MEEFGKFIVWIEINGREVEYATYHRLSSAKSEQDKLRDMGYEVFVEDVSQ